MSQGQERNPYQLLDAAPGVVMGSKTPVSLSLMIEGEVEASRSAAYVMAAALQQRIESLLVDEYGGFAVTWTQHTFGELGGDG